MRQRLWLTVFVIAGALLAVGQDNVSQDRRDLNQDHRDVRHDRRDVNHDRVDRNRGIPGHPPRSSRYCQRSTGIMPR
jgi:hypothetical protein